MTGRELRRIRRGLGLTQAQMAKKLGIARDSLGRYERHARRVTKLLAIAVRCVASHGSRR